MTKNGCQKSLYKFFTFSVNISRLMDAIYSKKQKIDSSVDKIGNIKSQNFFEGSKRVKTFHTFGNYKGYLSC